jgi:ATP/maltotriose-dependent transcriptional regulator MalT
VAGDLLDSASAGHGSVLAVVGEAGIGKSRLAEQIAGMAASWAMEVLWSSGWSGGGAAAYWPWPEILGALDMPSGGTVELASTSPNSERFGRFRSALAMLRQRAAEHPLLVVLDDAHAIDADGLRLTRFIAGHVPPSGGNEL